MADVLLVNPRIEEVYNPGFFKNRFIGAPYALACMASYLEEKGYKVKIVDVRPAVIEGDESYKKVIEQEAKNGLLLAGIGCMTATIKQTLEITSLIKNANPDVPVILGGAHPEFFPKQTCEDPLIDFVCTGEGEYTTAELAKQLEINKGEKKGFENIRGLTYKDEKGNARINTPQPFVNLDQMPFPAYHLLDVPKYYLRGKPTHFDEVFRSAVLQTSRGCPYHCTFCIDPALEVYRSWRAKSPEKVVSEIRRLVDTYNIEHLEFRDENCFTNIGRVKRIAELLMKEKIDIKWGSTCRAEYLARNIQPDQMDVIRKSGFSFVDIGAESGSNRILELIKKGITTAETLRAAEICTKYDIVPAFSLIIGIPTETREDLHQTLSLMGQLKKINKNSKFYGPFIYRPYPGAELYQLAKQMGFEEPKNLREWIDLDVFDETGFAPVENLPWIGDKETLSFLNQNAAFLFYSIKEQRNAAKKIYAAIQKFRWQTGFFKFRYERDIYTKLRQASKISVLRPQN